MKRANTLHKRQMLMLLKLFLFFSFFNWLLRFISAHWQRSKQLCGQTVCLCLFNWLFRRNFNQIPVGICLNWIVARLQRAEQLQWYSQQTDQGRVKENGLALEPLQQAQTGSHSTQNARPWQNNHACTQSTCACVCADEPDRRRKRVSLEHIPSSPEHESVFVCVCVSFDVPTADFLKAIQKQS